MSDNRWDEPKHVNMKKRNMSSYRQKAPKYKREGKKPFPVWTIPVILTCVAIISLVVWYGSSEYEVYQQYRQVVSKVNVDTFYPGIAVNGIDIGGMTMEQAISSLGEEDTRAHEEFALTIAYGETRWRITSQEVLLAFDTQDVLDRAYALGRRGGLRERYQAIQNLAHSGSSFTTSMGYDKEKVRELTDIVATRLTKEATNAKLYAFEVSARTFTFTSEAAGYRADADALYRDVIAALDAGDYDEVIKPNVESVAPVLTKDMLVSMFGRISSYSTDTTTNKNRNANITLSAEAINGSVVMPGETLSFNDSTGERTSAKGYREAGAISGGVLIDATGGGVCQTSSTLFNAVVRADLEIVDRTEHSWPSSYVPKGEDAAVDWPRLDFKFKNTQDTPVFIVAWYGDQKVTVEVYGRLLDPGVTIDLHSDLIRTLKPSDEIAYVQDTSLSSGTSKAGRKKRTGYVVDTFKVYYKDGVETSRTKIWRTTYKSSQQTILWN